MALFIKAAALAVVAATVAPEPDIRVVIYPLVHKVSCDEGSGSAFRVGLNHWASVAHVTTMHNCTVEGQKIAVTEQNGSKDFSRFDTRLGISNGFRVNCAGFLPGHWYYAVGHAFGRDFQTLISVYATYAKSPNGQRVLIGPYDFIPGMSGGPVLDSAGSVVGTVNAYIPETPISLSRELKDTSICGGGIA